MLSGDGVKLYELSRGRRSARRRRGKVWEKRLLGSEGPALCGEKRCLIHEMKEEVMSDFRKCLLWACRLCFPGCFSLVDGKVFGGGGRSGLACCDGRPPPV